MNEFKLFAHGDNFDVDAFLAATTLKADDVWRRGDQRRNACVESKHEASGVEFVLGDGCALSLLDQENVAIDYLKAHRDELKALAIFPGVQTFILGLHYVYKLNLSMLGFCIGPSPSLMWLCLDIGIDPDYYVTFDRSDLDKEREEFQKRMEEWVEYRLQHETRKDE